MADTGITVVVWGGTGQARVLRPMIEDLGLHIGCVCDRSPDVAAPFPGIPLFTDEGSFFDWRKTWDPGSLRFVVAIGGTRGRDRLVVHNYLCRLGLTPLSLVHRTAFVDPSSVLGDGAQVAAMAAVSVGCRVGTQFVANTNCSVDHDCVIGDGVHVMPGATIAGEAVLGDRASIGSNATVLPRLRIGADAIVGAGAVVTADVPPSTTVVGVPARALPVRARSGGPRPDDPWVIQ